MAKFLNSDKGSVKEDEDDNNDDSSKNLSRQKEIEESFAKIKKGRGLKGLNSRLSVKKMQNDLK